MARLFYSVLSNSQRLDAGAMFGHAPKALWRQWYPPDEQNRMTLACRCLLVKDSGRNILFETGIGAFFSPKMRDRFGVIEDRHVLVESLAALGLTPSDIHVVVLSHLHFDHAGGLLSAYEEGPLRLIFDKASLLVGAEAFARAVKPHARDKASFIPELPQLLQDSGRLELIEHTHSPTLGPDYRFMLSYGHTPGMLLTEVQSERGPILFAADLIPGTRWLHTGIGMGYDRYAELVCDEKGRILHELAQSRGRVFYTHDPDCALSKVLEEPDGRFSMVECEATLQGTS